LGDGRVVGGKMSAIREEPRAVSLESS